MTCSVVKGDLPLTITWRKDGRSIDPSQRMSVTQVDQYNSILVIENLSAEHTGNYSCVVRNLAAEVDSTQALLVNGNRIGKTKNCHYFLSYLFFFLFFLFLSFYCSSTTILLMVLLLTNSISTSCY